MLIEFKAEGQSPHSLAHTSDDGLGVLDTESGQ